MKQFSLNESVTVVEAILNSGGTVNFNPRGTSMLPTLHNDGDRVVIKKVDELNVNDIALYKRGSQLVLHRVVKVYKHKSNNSKGYGFCGDNQSKIEKIIPESSIVGKVITIYRKGKQINVNNNIYKAYSWLLFCSLPLRKLISPLKKLRKFYFPTKVEIENKAEAVSNDIIKYFSLNAVNKEAELLIYKATVAYLMQFDRHNRNTQQIKNILLRELAKDSVFEFVSEYAVCNIYYKSFCLIANKNKESILRNCIDRLNLPINAIS